VFELFPLEPLSQAWRKLLSKTDYLRLCVVACLAVSVLTAGEYRGQVTFGGLPVPGATVTATAGGRHFAAITDLQGQYDFPDLPEENWTIEIQMSGFETVEKPVSSSTPAKWELKLLPLDRIKAQVQSAAVSAQPVPPAQAASPSAQNEPKNGPAPKPEPAAEDLNQRAADGFLINGSSQNGAASPFAQLAAFGNNRNGSKGLYNGAIGVTFDNSALDAQQFSLTGQNTPKLSYNRMTGLAALGGPLQIGHLFKRPPVFFALYQWTRNKNASTLPGLMPDLAERNGIFSNPVLDPTTGVPFPGNQIPQNRFSPQAQALLNFYPLPNFTGNAGYNYQVPILSPSHQDALQSRFNKSLGNRDQVYGRFAFQSTRSNTQNLFDFLDTTSLLGINTSVNWSHRLDQQWFLNLGVQFSRLATHITPYFENRENVSGDAGISGNDQNPMNWGPPGLTFASGIAGLSDAQSSFDRNQTSGLSGSMLWNRGAHNIMLGSDFRRQEFNYLSQQNPRGIFTFTGEAAGAAVGSDFADFLLGIPDTSSIAYGNADKYFRQSVYDAFLNDDWRISPELSVNAGVRWEYGAPITELYGRLVNLDVIPGFAAVAPVVASDPIGTLTGLRYPSSLVHPDKRGFEPRVGLAWRPLSGSSMVVRAGFGVYYDTSVYQTVAVQMAQQPPLSKTLTVQNSAADPLSLANGFIAPPSATSNTFAADPNFHAGYAQNWQVSLQRDLPGSLQMTATYLGIKGTRGPQEFLPNTYPIGAANPCPLCPAGFYYMTSNGNSTRQSGQIQLRRRLHNGLTGTLLYTFSKSIDDDAVLGGQGASATGQNSPNAASSGSSGTLSSSTTGPSNLAVAQNWLDLGAERSLSTFDQRHLLNLQMQYTTGMGAGGGTLLSGWRGALFKEWTFAATITAGSGLPETPVYLAAVPGTGVTGTIRPDYIGGSLLSRSAYIAPVSGQWGNAGRDTINGPAQFTLNTSLGRIFRVSDRLNLDLRVDSTNALNHVTYSTWQTTINSTQFGLPVAANTMRSLQTTLRLRF
jgi:trimeric autotransporter adhesin